MKTRKQILADAKKDPAKAQELDTVRAMMTGKPKVKTTELDKMALAKEKSQTVGEFLDWLIGTKGWTLASEHIHGPKCEGWDEHRGRFNPRGMTDYCKMGPDGRLWPASFTTENLLAEFFGIDLNKVEQERRSILAALRKY